MGTCNRHVQMCSKRGTGSSSSWASADVRGAFVSSPALCTRCGQTLSEFTRLQGCQDVAGCSWCRASHFSHLMTPVTAVSAKTPLSPSVSLRSSGDDLKRNDNKSDNASRDRSVLLRQAGPHNCYC